MLTVTGWVTLAAGSAAIGVDLAAGLAFLRVSARLLYLRLAL